LADFFKRPTNARITRKSSAAIWRPFEGGNDDSHLYALRALRLHIFRRYLHRRNHYLFGSINES
jgi:hypothetical protein